MKRLLLENSEMHKKMANMQSDLMRLLSVAQQSSAAQSAELLSGLM